MSDKSSHTKTDGGTVADPDPVGTTATAESESTGLLSDTVAFWISAITGIAVAVGAVSLVQGPSFQTILRVRPTVEGGGVGTAWIAGNTEPMLNLMISLIHLVDVVMGVFIIIMVMIHWAAFRRLADRMKPPKSGSHGGDSA